MSVNPYAPPGTEAEVQYETRIRRFPLLIYQRRLVDYGRSRQDLDRVLQDWADRCRFRPCGSSGGRQSFRRGSWLRGIFASYELAAMRGKIHTLEWKTGKLKWRFESLADSEINRDLQVDAGRMFLTTRPAEGKGDTALPAIGSSRLQEGADSIPGVPARPRVCHASAACPKGCSSLTAPWPATTVISGSS